MSALLALAVSGLCMPLGGCEGEAGSQSTDVNVDNGATVGRVVVYSGQGVRRALGTRVVNSRPLIPDGIRAFDAEDVPVINAKVYWSYRLNGEEIKTVGYSKTTRYGHTELTRRDRLEDYPFEIDTVRGYTGNVANFTYSVQGPLSVYATIEGGHRATSCGGCEGEIRQLVIPDGELSGLQARGGSHESYCPWEGDSGEVKGDGLVDPAWTGKDLHVELDYAAGIDGGTIAIMKERVDCIFNDIGIAVHWVRQDPVSIPSSISILAEGRGVPGRYAHRHVAR